MECQQSSDAAADSAAQAATSMEIAPSGQYSKEPNPVALTPDDCDVDNCDVSQCNEKEQESSTKDDLKATEVIPIVDVVPESNLEGSKFDAIVSKLTSGLLPLVLPEEEKQKNQLYEIINSQNVLIETIEHENSEFQDIQLIREVADIMDRARIYQTKLLNVKRDMMSLHEKTSQLKKRALKLQQQKQKEALSKEQQRDVELEKEKKLMAKVMLRKS